MSADSFIGVAGKYAFGSKSMICARGTPAHFSQPVRDVLPNISCQTVRYSRTNCMAPMFFRPSNFLFLFVGTLKTLVCSDPIQNDETLCQHTFVSRAPRDLCEVATVHD
jgi:hypothetical protein